MTMTEALHRAPHAPDDMAGRIRAFDWATTSLGAIGDWPEGLRTVVDLMLATPTIASLAVGPDRIFLYNDAAAAYYGDRHPGALGQPIAQVFAHEFGSVAAFYDRVFAGESLQIPAQPLDPANIGTVEVFEACLMPVRDAGGAVLAAYMTGSAVTARVRAEAMLRESERRFRGLVEGTPQIVWRTTPDGSRTWVSPQWRDVTGQSEADSLGEGWLAMLPADERDATLAAWHQGLAEPRVAAEHRLLSARDGRYRWFQTRALPVRDACGAVVEWLGTTTDIDDLRRLQEKQQHLLSEVQHRVRNILAVIRSVFSRTVAGEAPVDEMADHFRGRLDSIARAQLALTQSPSGGVDLENLIRDELRSAIVADGPGLVIQGPEVELAPRAAELLGLTIHELTTNALKYGALRVDGGRIDIRWSVGAGPGGVDFLYLVWTERGVPVMRLEPGHRGFGIDLIEEGLPYGLGGEASLTFRGSGVRCSIAVPLERPTS